MTYPENSDQLENKDEKEDFRPCFCWSFELLHLFEMNCFGTIVENGGTGGEDGRDKHERIKAWLAGVTDGDSDM